MKTFNDIVDEVMRKHERDKAIWKELQEWNAKPWWVQQQEEGDYHYNSWDMEPEEKEEE